MRKSLYIAFMSLATIIMVTLIHIPHHHHEGNVCMATEDSSHNNGGEDCVENCIYITAKISTTQQNAQTPLPSLLTFILPHTLILCDEDDKVNPVPPEYQRNNYKSAESDGTWSLRAPPAFV
jgi:hypothetical protein